LQTRHTVDRGNMIVSNSIWTDKRTRPFVRLSTDKWTSIYLFVWSLGVWHLDTYFIMCWWNKTFIL